MALSSKSAMRISAQITGLIAATSGQEFPIPASFVHDVGLTDDDINILAYSTAWTEASGDKDVTGLAAAGFTAEGGDDASGMALQFLIAIPVDEACDYQIADGSSNGYSTTLGTHDVRWGKAPVIIPAREDAVVVSGTTKTLAVTKTGGTMAIIMGWKTP